MRRPLFFVSALFLDRAAYAALLALLTYLFGVSEQTDIYFLVVLVPLMITNISNEVVFVMIMQSLSLDNNEEEYWLSVGRLLVFFALFFGVVAGAIVLFSVPLVGVLGFGLSVEAKRQGAELQPVAAMLVLGHGIGAVVGSVLLHRGHTFLGTMRVPLATSLGAITAVLLYYSGESGIGSFVSGGSVGAIVVAAVMLVKLLLLKGDNVVFGRKSLNFSRLAPIFALAFYNTLTNLSHSLIMLIERALASQFGTGAITQISLARTMVPILGGVPGAVANAWFVESMVIPYGRRMDQIPRLAAAVTRQALLVGLPMLVVFFLSVDNIVGFLFEQGKFSGRERDAVAHMAFLYGLGAIHVVLGGTVLKIYQMAHLDGRLAAWTYSSLILYILLAYVLGNAMGGGGLVLAYSISLNITVILLYVFLLKRFGLRVLDVPWFRLFLAASTSWLVTIACNAILPPVPTYFLKLVVVASVAATIFAIVAWAVNLFASPNWLRRERIPGRKEHD